ncbi:hypothetical protein [Clostridium vincentii]|uniref:Uncharacterized protein n=1 Tax=Clostridium vincentii TaxID=52704 RepID=A0A2T0BDL8_9CLOT|nr:hypothetical protein [Clostridium vincentii]PRR81912.1 hypothetical protein CLVI_21200 [Clostridium vincentii]
MDRKSCIKDDDEFIVYPSNFNVIIKQIRPLYVNGTRPIIIDCRRVGCPDIKSFMKIKFKPMHGRVYLVEPSILIYKANRCFCGIDMFQILFQDEGRGTHVESILIHVK